MRANKTSFRQWIDEMGAVEVSKLLRVTPGTVNHWRRGHCRPRSEQMLKIKKYSRGKVTVESILSTFVPKN